MRLKYRKLLWYVWSWLIRHKYFMTAMRFRLYIIRDQYLNNL